MEIKIQGRIYKSANTPMAVSISKKELETLASFDTPPVIIMDKGIKEADAMLSINTKKETLAEKLIYLHRGEYNFYMFSSLGGRTTIAIEDICKKITLSVIPSDGRHLTEDRIVSLIDFELKRLADEKISSMREVFNNLITNDEF